MRISLPGLWVWAARDVLRRPAEALLAGAAMASLIAVLSAGLLLARGLSCSAETVLEDAPSLVIRRLSPGGWAPVPTRALEQLRGVTGVTRASARIWGVVRWQEASVTILALTPDDAGTGDEQLTAPGPGEAITGPGSGEAITAPGPGEAITGPGSGEAITAPGPVGAITGPGSGEAITAPGPGEAITGPAFALSPGQTISLHGACERSVRVKKVLPASWGLVAHDLILLNSSDARALLGLERDAASDFAVWVFHDTEMDAIRPDLEAALPFPVQITSRRESLGAMMAQLEKASGLLTTLLIPALLALVLLTTAMARIQLGSRRDIGLLKALGWRSGDILRLHLSRALVIGLPALAVGWCLAYGAVFLSGLNWAGALLFGWSGAAPQLTLDPTGVLRILLEVGALVLAPCLAAILLPTLRSATVDAEEWLRGEES